MLQFRNDSPFSGTILLLQDPAGVDSLYTVIKATFAIRPFLALADTQVPIAVEPEYHGDPDASSLKVPSDISLMKPGTDVLLIGSAYAPGGRSTTHVDVSLAVASIRKTVRVFGDRSWVGDVGVSISRPAAFEVMPLVWERAYRRDPTTR